MQQEFEQAVLAGQPIDYFLGRGAKWSAALVKDLLRSKTRGTLRLWQRYVSCMPSEVLPFFDSGKTQRFREALKHHPDAKADLGWLVKNKDYLALRAVLERSGPIDSDVLKQDQGALLVMAALFDGLKCPYSPSNQDVVSFAHHKDVPLYELDFAARYAAFRHSGISRAEGYKHLQLYQFNAEFDEIRSMARREYKRVTPVCDHPDEYIWLHEQGFCLSASFHPMMKMGLADVLVHNVGPSIMDLMQPCAEGRCPCDFWSNDVNLLARELLEQYNLAYSHVKCLVDDRLDPALLLRIKKRFAPIKRKREPEPELTRRRVKLSPDLLGLLGEVLKSDSSALRLAIQCSESDTDVLLALASGRTPSNKDQAARCGAFLLFDELQEADTDRLRRGHQEFFAIKGLNLELDRRFEALFERRLGIAASNCAC